MLPPADTALFAAALVAIVIVLRMLAWRGLRLAIWSTWRLRALVTGPHVRDRARPLLERLRRRAPRLHGLLAARFDPERFAGLPLTLLVVAALYLGGLFGGLVEEVLEAEGVQHFDEAVNGLFAAWREPPLLTVFLWITELGAGPTLTAVSIVATGFLWAHRRLLFILPLWVSFLGAQATTWLGKYVIARTRPEFIDAASAVTPSFPSAHATAAMALYGFLAYVIARDSPSLRVRFEIAFWAAVLIALVGLSRMFLSVHFTSDVAAGFLVGGFWLLVGFALAELARAKETNLRPLPP